MTIIRDRDAANSLTKLDGIESPNGTVAITPLTYDMESRMKVLEHNGAKTTYTYDGDGLKRSENVSGTVTTIIWDGSECW